MSLMFRALKSSNHYSAMPFVERLYRGLLYFKLIRSWVYLDVWMCGSVWVTQGKWGSNVSISSPKQFVDPVQLGISWQNG